MKKRILQDMYMRNGSSPNQGETIIKIIRKDYPSPEQVVVETESENPVDDIEIPGEIDIGDIEENKGNYRSSRPLHVENTIVDEDNNRETTISSEKSSLIAELVSRRPKQSSGSQKSSLPVVHDFIITKKENQNPASSEVKTKTTFRLPRIPLKTLVVTASVLVGIVLLVFSISFFEKAYITIIPKQKQFSVNNELFTASKDPRSNLNFEIMVFDDTEQKAVSFVETQQVSIKATGEIVLFNEYSSKPQTFVAGAYLADRSGKAYQLAQKTTIPGYTMTKSKTIIPGQVVARATAFLPGDEYNTTTGNFTFSALKKDPAMFQKIYGKLKTPFRSGAQGLVYVLTDAQKATLLAYAQTTYRASLLKKVRAQIPKGYLFFDNAISYNYSVDSDVKSKTPSGKVPVTGSISAVLIRETDISRALVGRLLPKLSEKETGRVVFDDMKNLSFEFTQKAQPVSKAMTSLSFSLSGKINAVWNPDTDTLHSSVVGVKKSTLPTLFARDPGIGNARVTIFPPWKSTLPKNPEKIIIIRE